MNDPSDPSAAPELLAGIGWEALFKMGIDLSEPPADLYTRDWQSEFPREVEKLRALVENPNTPPKILGAIAEILPLPVLRHPAFSKAWHEGAFTLTLERIPAPGALDKQISIAVRPWLRRLLMDGPSEVFELAPRDALFARRFGEWLNDWVRARSTSGEDLELLSHSPDATLRRRVAGHGNLLPRTATRLLMDRDDSVRGRATRHSAAPADLKELLSRAKRSAPLSPEEVARLLAGGPYARELSVAYLDEAQLIRLYETGDRVTRVAIAGGRRIDALTEEMGRDPDPEIRQCLARRASTDWLARLADDPDKWVRYTVVLNPATPISVLRRLSEDAERVVREQACSRLAEG